MALSAACADKKEPKLTQAPVPPPITMGQAENSSEIPSLSNAITMVPEKIKAKWKSVKFLVEDKKEKSLKEYVVGIGTTWRIPESSLEVKVGDFLPDLIIQGKVFTTATDELKNPAVHVTVSEGGKELFKGWLFSLFPMMHPFQHERFGITLKDIVVA
jgi:hypothetical protein